ncbi:MAG TPA: hypothetical protein DEQ52_06685 [Ruminococcaceae bacterium]|nr:hypothetical protein [Oscillospiraceae bacterium]
MPELNVIVRGKIAQGVKGQYAVCENSDYTVKFDFDDDWRSQKYKTARFIWNDKYEDVVFEGDECSLPIVSDTYCLKVGVFAGDLQTTTPAIIVMKKSILCGSATAEKPSEDVYSQIMALLNDLKELSDEELAAAIEKYLTEHPIGGGGASTAEDISYTLSEDVQTDFPDIVELESDTVKSGLDVAMYYAFAGMFAKYIQCDVPTATGTVTFDLQTVMDGWRPALEQAHEHDNKSILDLISAADGKLRYNAFDINYAPAQYTYSTAQVSATLADNAEYRMTGLQTLTVQYPENAKFECWMRLSFAESGDITVTLPAGTGYIGTAPDFKNGETWELSFKDKILAAQKVGDGA